MEVDQVQELPEVIEDSPPPPPRARQRERRPHRSRFKGFDVGLDDDDEKEEQSASATVPHHAEEASQGMFMTQQEDNSTQAGRKRALPEPERDIMEDVAPTAAAMKRRRIERGEDPVPPREPTPPAAPSDEDIANSRPPQSKGKGGGRAAAPKRGGKAGPTDPDDFLDMAIRYREEEDAAAQAERDRLARELQDGDVDFEAIRRLTLVEPMAVRSPVQNQRSRDQDIEEGRWDPRWNGRKNFKRFRKQGEPSGRPQQKVIMSLEPVRMKEYGIGDDYWLEGEVNTQGRQSGRAQSQAQSQIAPTRTPGGSQALRREREAYVIGSDCDDDLGEGGNGGEDESLPDAMEVVAAPSRSRKGKAAEKTSSKQSQASTSHPIRGSRQESGSKRAATGPPARETPAKKRATRATRATRQVEASDDEEDSDDGLNFKFGKRR